MKIKSNYFQSYLREEFRTTLINVGDEVSALEIWRRSFFTRGEERYAEEQEPRRDFSAAYNAFGIWQVEGMVIQCVSTRRRPLLGFWRLFFTASETKRLVRNSYWKDY